MSIRMMCDKGAAGAYWQPYHGAPDGGVWMVESHKGLVLSLHERNGYDDSDFYAKVWNAEKGCVQSIEYASTRGWSYPNGANVDATPEVIEAARAWVEARRKAWVADRDAVKAKAGDFGSWVTINGCRGAKKALNGQRGEVFWVGPGYRSWDPDRIGVRLENGDKVFVAATLVTVDGADKNMADARRELGAIRRVESVVGVPALC